MAYRWETASSVWLEDEKSAQFALASTEGLGRIDWQARAPGRLPDIARLLGASLPQSCQCAAIYPEGFAFCPDCGHALATPVQSAPPLAAPPAPWWGPWCDQSLPRHVPHGLRVTSLALGDSLEERPAAPAPGRPDVQMPVPPNAECVFAAGSFGFPAERLIALAHARNVLQYFDPLAATWQVLAPEDGAADLSFASAAYAWLPALHPRRGEVGVVPTSKGLERLFINPVSETYRTESVFSAPLVSAPGAMRRHLGCLYAAGGKTRLWTAHLDRGTGDSYDTEAPAGRWTRPLGYDGRLFWLHAQGQLIWQPGAPPEWIAWPAGWSPRLRFGGPTQSRDGRLWMIGHAGSEYSFLELGKRDPHSEPLSGARLGFASLLFRRGHAVVGEPWDLEHVEDPHDDDALVLPLLRGFNNNRAQPSGLVLRFHSYTGKAEEALGERVIPRTTVEWIGKRNVILDDIPRLSRPLACEPFVYNGCLWLHHPDWNHVRGWRLEEQL